MARSSRSGPIILAFLFLSGGTGLVYELVWSKYLANLLGNSGQAHALVLATFMGGLALGAWVFGSRADRVQSPLRMYGVLELGIGVYALLFAPILSGLGAVYLQVASALPDSVRLFPKLFLAALSLLPPTMLMGGTLPALARHFTAHLGGFQRELARLYAVNSVGAACGVFLAGVQLVPSVGLAASSRLAAALNIALAVGAIALSRRTPAATGAKEAEPEGTTYPRRAVRAALVGVALSGFTAMLYEITWIRVLAIVLGASTYAFTLILTAFILGIGVGSFWLMAREERLRREGRPPGDSLRLFGWLQLLLVGSVCIALPLYIRLPHYFMLAYDALNRTPQTWPWYQLVTFGFCCLVLLVPTFFMGAGFPAAARVATARVSELGRQLGGVYLWNTLGTISGSLLGGLVLMPLFGLEGNFAIGIALNLVAGALALSFAPSRPASRLRALWPVAAGALVALLYLASSAGWAEFLSDAGNLRQWGKTFPSFDAYYRATKRGVDVLYREDDVFATVLVAQLQGKRHRYMRINGKIDASNGEDVSTQVLAGHLGVLFHGREVKRVLVIGAGAAITVGSLLAHPLERLDLVEISPAVIDAARLFGEDNRRALDDPRVRIHIDDAKTFMALARERYDLIVSVPSNPWVTGVSGLFSRDFFQVAREHLAEDGLVVQWIHTYYSSEEVVSLVMRTLRESFPHATTWAGPYDLIMVAGRAPTEFDLERLRARIERPEVKEDLARIDIPDLVTLLAKQVHSEEGQAEFAGEGPINTDDHNLLEYRAPFAYFVAKTYVRVRDERRAPASTRRLYLHRLLEERPLAAEQAAAIHRNLSRSHPGHDPLVRSIAEAWHRLAPELPEARVAVATAALEQDDLAAAREALGPLADAQEPSIAALKTRLEEAERRVSPGQIWSKGP